MISVIFGEKHQKWPKPPCKPLKLKTNINIQTRAAGWHLLGRVREMKIRLEKKIQRESLKPRDHWFIGSKVIL